MHTTSLKGRGTTANPAGRFELIRYEPLDEGERDECSAPATQFLKDATNSIIATNDSPDVGFSASINPYRGCEHGCIYCYARPYHEYLGLSAGLDFETKIMVKPEAPHLLRKELSARKWQPQILGMSGVTDCYQPIERRMELTRQCLEVLAEFRNPCWIVTKNRLVTRDIDVLQKLAAHRAVAVAISVTTLDPHLASIMEPRASTPKARLEAIRALTDAGIPTTVLTAPLIPGLNDHEVPALLAAARDAGAWWAGYVVLRLPFGIGPLFSRWLDQHFPRKKKKILSRIQELRSGKMNDPRFGHRMRGEGELANAIEQMYEVTRKKLAFAGRPTLSTAAFCRPGETPPSLFDGLE